MPAAEVFAVEQRDSFTFTGLLDVREDKQGCEDEGGNDGDSHDGGNVDVKLTARKLLFHPSALSFQIISLIKYQGVLQASKSKANLISNRRSKISS